MPLLAFRTNERLDDSGSRIGRAVVNDDHLMRGHLLIHQRIHGGADEALLAVGEQNDAGFDHRLSAFRQLHAQKTPMHAAGAAAEKVES